MSNSRVINYPIKTWSIIKTENEEYLFRGLLPEEKHEVIDVCKVSDLSDLINEMESLEKIKDQLNESIKKIEKLIIIKNNLKDKNGEESGPF